MQYVSDMITPSEIETWEGHNIILDYQTGSGKTQFICNVLAPFCKAQEKTILCLVNRVALRNQMKTQYISAGVDLMSYQQIEAIIKNDLCCTLMYDYIICDEAHYVFVDSGFNEATFLSFDWVMEQSKSTKIFMSATCDLLVGYFNQAEIPCLHYQGDRDYSYIEELMFFQGSNDISVLIDRIPPEQKILVFTTLNVAENLQNKYNGESAVICSESNKKSNETMKARRQYIESNERFEERILFTTIVLDNGVNIKDDQVKHIIIDIFNIDTIIQCIGRKRINDGEKIRVYINNEPKKLNFTVPDLEKHYCAAKLLMEEGQDRFVQAHFYDFYNYSALLYLDYLHTSGRTFLINQYRYYSYGKQIEYIRMLSEVTHDTRYMDDICTRLQQVPTYLYWEEVRNKLDILLGEYSYKMSAHQAQKALASREKIVEQRIMDMDGMNEFASKFNTAILPIMLSSKACITASDMKLINTTICYFNLTYKVSEGVDKNRRKCFWVEKYRDRGKPIRSIGILKY